MTTGSADSATLLIAARTPVEEVVQQLHCNPEFVRVDHSDMGVDNLTVLSRRAENPANRIWAKSLIVELARNGYILYMVQDGISRFLRKESLSSVWHRIKNGEFEVSNHGVVYSVLSPKLQAQKPKLLVMFSTIHDNMYSPSLLRYFMKNFKTIDKYIPAGTNILRIADIGGVTGAFYLNTVADGNNSNHIREVIRKTASKLGVADDDIVLYGASKGGTGALFNALNTGWKCIAVDPIVSDEHYVVKHDDSHFTASGIFPETKQELFKRTVNDAIGSGLVAESQGRWVVICSERSPQYTYIKEILMDQLDSDMLFINSLHPAITDHPHVGINTVNWSTMFINMLFYGIRLDTGVMDGI